MPSTTVQSVEVQGQRSELEAVLQSPLFARSPALARLLSYLCERAFAGEGGKIKEYSIALDVFRRKESFDQESDSIVRVEANRLRKRLAHYYGGEGANHVLRITIPIGQYAPVFEEVSQQEQTETKPTAVEDEPPRASATPRLRSSKKWFFGTSVAIAIVLLLSTEVYRERPRALQARAPAVSEPSLTEADTTHVTGLTNEVRILAGATKSYMDHSGKLWNPDSYYSGGVGARSPMHHIWRTQDPAIYRSSRQGAFSYAIPLKPGVYELRLHFAEMFYGPEEDVGGGEGSRVMNVAINGKPALTDFDVVADSGGGRTADVKVFTDIKPATDGLLHLDFSSANGARALLSAIEIAPGVAGRMRPIRIVARDVPYYSNDSHWWSADIYFQGGQVARSDEPVTGADDPELYETDRWGHFSYAIPVMPGRYTVVLHSVRRGSRSGAGDADGGASISEAQTFDVFCNGKAVVHHLSLVAEAGPNKPLVRKITGLVPNTQGKLLLEFIPVTGYATVSAIEVIPQ